MQNMYLKQHYSNFIVPNFKKNDFAVTLTYKLNPCQFSSKYVPDYIKASNDMRHLLNVINYKMFARKFKTGKVRLKNAHVFEQSAYAGLHVHMLLENPTNLEMSEPDKANLILNAWIGMKCSGYYNANKIVPIYDVEGWSNYCCKSITKINTSCCDLSNWHLMNKPEN